MSVQSFINTNGGYMATQEGFLYESNAYKSLRKPIIHKDISTGGVAGASHDRPDLTIKVGNNTAGVELKNQPTAAGSLVLQFQNGTWQFGPTDDNPEKEFLKALGKKTNVLEILNKNWKTPVLQYDARGNKIYIGATLANAYARDLKEFAKLPMNVRYIDVPTKVISDYYNKKKTYYLNVGTHGLFLLGSDPLGINKKLASKKLPPIPNFAKPGSATTKIRIRVQDKGGGSYQITFTLQFGMTASQKSPYNIAPLMAGSSSSINIPALRADGVIQVL